MRVLGIETSCDETAVAIVTDDQQVVSNQLFSQVQAHAPYGGVVPEIASRAHMDALDHLIVRAFEESGCDWDDIDAIAVTTGPGLIGGLIVGVMTAKAIASVRQLPLVAVNHLEAHALTVRLTDDVTFPYLLLLVSGGHCQLLIVRGVGEYEQLGTTLDDALGEAFDKTAKMLGLGYPGGPAVERRAAEGDPQRFAFPEPLKHRKGCDFSFSGLKTAVRQQVAALRESGTVSHQDAADICASFQYTVGNMLETRVRYAIEEYRQRTDNHKVAGSLVIAGGVAANRYLRERLTQLGEKQGMKLVVPPVALCTDNAVMVAWAGIERLRHGLTDDLRVAPRARWPLHTMQNANPVGGV